jgi:hypothetical protein
LENKVWLTILKESAWPNLKVITTQGNKTVAIPKNKVVLHTAQPNSLKHPARIPKPWYKINNNIQTNE